MNKISFLVAFIFLTFTHYAFSNLIENNAPKAEVLIKEELQKIGEADFSFLFWDIYHSTLYSNTGVYRSDNKNQIILYKINYLRDIKKADLIENTIEQWQHLGVSTTDFEPYVSQLANLWPDIKKGDSLSLLIAAQGSDFYFNGQYLGSIEDDKFGKLFLDIWLSPNTSQPKLRQQLLGLTNSEPKKQS